MALRQLTLAAVLGILTSSTAQAQARSLTLREALDRAERVDPQVVQALGGYRSASAGVRSAYGQFLPDLRTGVNWSTSFSDGPSRIDPITNEVLPGGSSNSSLSLGASATYDLFTGFRRGRDLNAAKAARSQAQATLDYQRAQTRLRTTRAFVEALQAAELVVVRREAIRRAEEQFQIAVAKLATRAATVADSLTATVTLNEARLRLVSDERQLAASEATLARLVGEDGRITAVADSVLFDVAAVTDTTTLRAEAITRAPQVVRTEAAEDAASANLSAAKSQYFPNLNLSANTSFSGGRLNDYQLYNNRSLQLGLSYPLFNRFQREQQIASRRSDYETAVAQTADARREVGATLTSQLAALRAAELRVVTALANLDAARALVRVQLERYRIGSLTIDVLSRAQEQLDTAESEAVRARFEYVLAKAEIEALIGRTL